MSTQANPLASQTTEVTGLGAVDQEAAIARLVQVELAKIEAQNKVKANANLTAADIEKLLTQGDAPEAPKREFKLNVGGQIYNFDSQEAMDAAVAQAIASKQPTQPVHQTQAQAPSYDEAAFAKMLAEEAGTPKALEYALGHTNLERRLQALEAQNAALRMRETTREVEKLVPGFRPKNPQELAVVDQIRQQQGGAQDNPYAWEAAVLVANQRGLIKIEPPAQQGIGIPHQTTNQQALPPFLGNNTGAISPSEEDLIKRYSALSVEQLKALKDQISSGRR
jgi:hypothetical protein